MVWFGLGKSHIPPPVPHHKAAPGAPLPEQKIHFPSDKDGNQPLLHVPLDEVHRVLQVAIRQEQGVHRQVVVKVDLGDLSGELLNVL